MAGIKMFNWIRKLFQRKKKRKPMPRIMDETSFKILRKIEENRDFLIDLQTALYQHIKPKNKLGEAITTATMGLWTFEHYRGTPQEIVDRIAYLKQNRAGNEFQILSYFWDGTNNEACLVFQYRSIPR